MQGDRRLATHLRPSESPDTAPDTGALEAPAISVEALLTIDDLAAYLGLTVRAIYNRLHRNDGSIPPPIRIGRLLRWRFEDVQRWLDERRVSPDE